MTDTNNTILVADRLSFRYESGERHTVRDASLKLRAGRTFGVLGANESGKTTLARLLLGELSAEQGSITALGVPVRSTASRPRWLIFSRVLLTTLFAAATFLAFVHAPLFDSLLRVGAWSPALLLAVLEVAYQLKARSARVTGSSITERGQVNAELRRCGIGYISSEHEGGQQLDARATVEETIGRHMPLPNQARPGWGRGGWAGWTEGL